VETPIKRSFPLAAKLVLGMAIVLAAAALVASSVISEREWARLVDAKVHTVEQIAALFAEGFVVEVPLARLASYPRYLRTAETRLGRAIADPRKDEGKLLPLVPLLKRREARQLALAAAGRPDDTAEIRWLLEELRVAVFAPEIKPEGPVSPARITAAFEALGRDPRT